MGWNQTETWNKSRILQVFHLAKQVKPHRETNLFSVLSDLKWLEHLEWIISLSLGSRQSSCTTTQHLLSHMHSSHQNPSKETLHQTTYRNFNSGLNNNVSEPIMDTSVIMIHLCQLILVWGKKFPIVWCCQNQSENEKCHILLKLYSIQIRLFCIKSASVKSHKELIEWCLAAILAVKKKKDKKKKKNPIHNRQQMCHNYFMGFSLLLPQQLFS